MSNDFDDFDPLHDPDKDLEAKFRRLEQDEELEEFRAKMGEPSAAGKSFIVLCPSCQGKNRVSVTKVRSQMPRCGRCKGTLLS